MLYFFKMDTCALFLAGQGCLILSKIPKESKW